MAGILNVNTGHWCLRISRGLNPQDLCPEAGVRSGNLYHELALRGSGGWSLGYPPKQRSRIESLPLGLTVASLGCFESSQHPSEFVQKAGKNPAIKVDDFLVQGSRAKKVFSFVE